MNILIAGDFCPKFRIKGLLEEGKYAEVLGDVRKITEKAEVSVDMRYIRKSPFFMDWGISALISPIM